MTNANTSNANLKVIQDLYAAFGRRDMPYILNALTDDVTWGIVGRQQDMPFLGVREGAAGVQSFFKDMGETMEMHTFVPERFVATEDLVLVWGHYSWTMRKSGVAKDTPWLHEWTIRDGKVAKWRGRQDNAMLKDAYLGTSAADNVKVVQACYAAFGRGDIPAVLDLMTSDVTMGIVGRNEDLDWFGIRGGKAGAQEFFRVMMETHDIHTFIPDRFLGAEDKVFVWGHYTWTMRKSGVSGESTWLHEITLRDGKMCGWRGHNDTAMLLAAYYGQPAKKVANG